MTVAAGETAKLEIKISDDYRRAKRNHLFASAVVLVLALAAQSTLNIPGFPEANLSAPLAMAIAWVAALFFAEEFRSEYLLALVRNAEINAHSTDAQIDQVFGQRLGAMSDWTNFARDAANLFERVSSPNARDDLASTMAEIQKTATELKEIGITLLASLPPHKPEDAVERPELPEYRWAVGTLKGMADTISSDHTTLHAIVRLSDELNMAMPMLVRNLEQQAKLDQELLASFRRTSVSIHAGQRWSFRRDAVVAIGLFVLATAAVGWHEVEFWRAKTTTTAAPPKPSGSSSSQPAPRPSPSSRV